MAKQIDLEKINASNVGRLRLSEMEYTLVGDYNIWKAAEILAGKGNLYDKIKQNGDERKSEFQNCGNMHRSFGKSFVINEKSDHAGRDGNQREPAELRDGRRG